jgi:hypothetical protein
MTTPIGRRPRSKAPSAIRMIAELYCPMAVIVLTLLISSTAPAQATFTAERRLTVQVGAIISIADSGLPANTSILYKRIVGGGVYGTFDPHPRLGGEAIIRQMYGGNIGERSYLAGPRYYRPIRRYTPYAKVLFGRGTFKFPGNIGELSLPIIAPGVGVSYRTSSTFQIRVDYEHQSWLGFDRKVTNFPGGLSPQVLSFGVAYCIR